MKSPILDSLHRPLEEVRLSLTDRCNYRCNYCMPADKTHSYLNQNEFLTIEQMTILVSCLMQLGLKSLRLTGGEPLLRSNIIEIVQSLSSLGLQDLSLTTNGELLTKYAKNLADAGLKRVTISLDSLDKNKFAMMTGGYGKLSQVLAGIEATIKSGLEPIKINCLTKKNFSETEILPLVQWAEDKKVHLRFIEYMDVGNKNDWQKKQVLTSDETKKIIMSRYQLIAEKQHKQSQTANNYLTKSGSKIGFVSSISQPFCQNCSRARVSSSGVLFLCLFAKKGFDLKPYLVADRKEELIEVIRSIWQGRTDAYSQQRQDEVRKKSIEMYHIGG